jgi:hypothetical protein
MATSAGLLATTGVDSYFRRLKRYFNELQNGGPGNYFPISAE